MSSVPTLSLHQRYILITWLLETFPLLSNSSIFLDTHYLLFSSRMLELFCEARLYTKNGECMSLKHASVIPTHHITSNCIETQDIAQFGITHSEHNTPFTVFSLEYTILNIIARESGTSNITRFQTRLLDIDTSLHIANTQTPRSHKHGG